MLKLNNAPYILKAEYKGTMNYLSREISKKKTKKKQSVQHIRHKRKFRVK